MRGLLIVVEGTDGSGKQTQAALLRDALRRMDYPVLPVSFPRYGNPWAKPVERYLSGDLGTDPSRINPFGASLFYSVDRYAAWETEMRPFYESGGIIVADRYVTSNALHQAPKLPPEKRTDYLDWLYGLEFGRLGLPRPDAVLYLDVAVESAASNVSRRTGKPGVSRDIHETDRAYMKSCRDAAAEIAAHGGWTVVPCMDAVTGLMLPVESVHGEIMRHVRGLLERHEENRDINKKKGDETNEHA